MAVHVGEEGITSRHLGLTIKPWLVELHGRLNNGLSSRIEKELDDVYQDTFYGGNVRPWMNGATQVFLLAVENDVFYVFTHILQHFYKGGIGLRQICDWCRLLWTYNGKIDVKKLEKRLVHSKLITTWKAFAAFAVDYLGMPVEAIPFYSHDRKWHLKADNISLFVMKVGDLGQNREMRYYGKKSYFLQKVISFGQRLGDLIRHAGIFPSDSMRFFPKIMFNGVISAIRGE